jgi:hypothetical protein
LRNVDVNANVSLSGSYPMEKGRHSMVDFDTIGFVFTGSFLSPGVVLFESLHRGVTLLVVVAWESGTNLGLIELNWVCRIASYVGSLI